MLAFAGIFSRVGSLTHAKRRMVMTINALHPELAKAIKTAEQGHTLTAMVQLEDAYRESGAPLVASYLGYCLAKEQHQFKRAVALCREAIEREPGEVLHFLNLGRVYLEAGQKIMAIKSFRQGMKISRNRQIMVELNSLGVRKEPVFSSLSRTHVLNRFFGLFFNRLGLR